MTDKKKRLARALSKKTGMSHQASINSLDASKGNHPSQPVSDYASTRRSFRAASLDAWSKVVRALTGSDRLREWRDPAEIAAVLDRVGKEAPLNHCMLPVSGGLAGGMDLSGAAISSAEPGCILLDFDRQQDYRLLRPASLTLVRPQHDTLEEWAYLRLECRLLDSALSGQSGDRATEEVVELMPGHYVDSRHWYDGTYGIDDSDSPTPLPAAARLIERQLKRGTFAVFAKGCAYNAGVYEDEHDMLNAEQFAQLIQNTVDRLVAEGAYGRDPLAG